MNHQVAASAWVVGILSVMTVIGVTPAGAQNEALRTAWGDPNLQGIWDFSTITPLERSEDLVNQAFLTEEEAADLEQEAVDRDIRLQNAPRRRTEAGGNVSAYNNFWMDRGRTTVATRRTSQIVDPPNGRLPELTKSAQERLDARRTLVEENPAASWLELSVSDRCLMGFNAGPPISPGFYNQNLQIFQTSDHLALLTEMVHTVRVVPLDERAPLDANIRQWSGESRGQWEGDTLVVTTSNFNGRSAWDRCPVFRSLSPTNSLTLVERITRVDAETLEYAYTVTDPRTWTRSWSASLTFRRTDSPIYEYACHEGNHAIANILAGARAAEKAERE
jgi:hypothetical protein